MVKYCQKCGAQNPDDSVFCVSCGSKLMPEEGASTGSGNAQTPPPPPGWTQQDQMKSQQGITKGRVERAFDDLFSHLNLVIPLVLLFIFEIIVYVAAILASLGIAIFSFSSLTHISTTLFLIANLLIFLAYGVILFIVSFEGSRAINGQPYSVSEAMGKLKSNPGNVVALIVVFALVEVVLSIVPLVGDILMALALAYFVIAFIQPVNLYSSLKKPLELFEMMSKDDSISLIILIILGLLSIVPLLYVFTVPAAILIALIYYQDKGQLHQEAIQPPPPP